MIILSNGMIKSGSSVFSWVQKEILTRAYPNNGQKVLEEQIKIGVIPGKGHYVSNIAKTEILNSLVHISTKHGPVVVKSHSYITKNIEELINNNLIISTFTHRDPRDIILSAVDHGKRDIINKKKDSYFKRFTNIENSIYLVKDACKIALEWLNSGLTTTFSYADLIKNPRKEILRFCKLIDFTPDDEMIANLVNIYFENPVEGMRQFNTGKAMRFKEEMTDEEIKFCNNRLRNEIINLGYSI